jgi:hypothetical protein
VCVFDLSVLVLRCVVLRVDGCSSFVDFVDSSFCVFVVVGGRRLVVASSTSIVGESSLPLRATSGMISGLDELAAGGGSASSIGSSKGRLSLISSFRSCASRLLDGTSGIEVGVDA